MTTIGPGPLPTELRIEGVFDIAAARRLAAAIDEALYAEVEIDMTGVREFHDFAVALLGQTIAGRRARTSVRGLGEHHLRVLRHLGIDPTGAALPGGSGASPAITGP